MPSCGPERWTLTKKKTNEKNGDGRNACSNRVQSVIWIIEHYRF